MRMDWDWIRHCLADATSTRRTIWFNNATVMCIMKFLGYDNVCVCVCVCLYGLTRGDCSCLCGKAAQHVCKWLEVFVDELRNIVYRRIAIAFSCLKTNKKAASNSVAKAKIIISRRCCGFFLRKNCFCGDS